MDNWEDVKSLTDDAKQSVNNAVQSIGKIVIERYHGYDNLTEERVQFLTDVLNTLLRIRNRL